MKKSSRTEKCTFFEKDPNLKFQASSLFLRLCRLVCVRPCRKPRRPVFSRHSSNALTITCDAKHVHVSVRKSLSICAKHTHFITMYCKNACIPSTSFQEYRHKKSAHTTFEQHHEKTTVVASDKVQHKLDDS